MGGDWLHRSVTCLDYVIYSACNAATFHPREEAHGFKALLNLENPK